jgi:hypothetical protein
MHCAAGGSVSEFPGPEPTARPLSHRPHRFSRASVYATDCVLTPRLRCSSIYESSNRPHRCPPKRQRQGPHARLSKRYRNNHYDLQYDFLGGRAEPRTELLFRKLILLRIGSRFDTKHLLDRSLCFNTRQTYNPLTVSRRVRCTQLAPRTIPLPMRRSE